MNEPTTTIPTPPVMTDTLEASPCISEITGALVALQLRHATAVLDKTNPRFKSRYTSLYSLQQAVLPILAEHGVAVIQNLSTEATERGTILVVQTLFSHPSGEWLRARSASGPLDRSDIQSTVVPARTCVGSHSPHSVISPRPRMPSPTCVITTMMGSR